MKEGGKRTLTGHAKCSMIDKMRDVHEEHLGLSYRTGETVQGSPPRRIEEVDNDDDGGDD